MECQRLPSGRKQFAMFLPTRITALAEEWASKPTAVVTANGAYGGAIRRDNGANFVRMLFALQAISGNIGKSGGGYIDFFYFVPTTMKAPSTIPGVPQLNPRVNEFGKSTGKTCPIFRCHPQPSHLVDLGPSNYRSNKEQHLPAHWQL